MSSALHAAGRRDGSGLRLIGARIGLPEQVPLPVAGIQVLACGVRRVRRCVHLRELADGDVRMEFRRLQARVPEQSPNEANVR